MPAFETVNSILEESPAAGASGNEVRSIHPIANENYTDQTYELMNVIATVPEDSDSKIMSPRDVNRQAAAMAGLPKEIASYMENYLQLSEQHAAFHGHHN
jgi:hypothetical protein